MQIRKGSNISRLSFTAMSRHWEVKRECSHHSFIFLIYTSGFYSDLGSQNITVHWQLLQYWPCSILSTAWVWDFRNLLFPGLLRHCFRRLVHVLSFLERFKVRWIAYTEVCYLQFKLENVLTASKGSIDKLVTACTASLCFQPLGILDTQSISLQYNYLKSEQCTMGSRPI